MRGIPLSLLTFCLLAAAAAGEDAPRAVPVVETPATEADAIPRGPDFSGDGQVVSRSEQFRVKGGDGLVRGSVAILAEEAKTELLDLTEEKDEWRKPTGSIYITITLHGKQGDPIPPRTMVTNLVFSEAGYELLIDVHLSRGIEQEEFKREITTALIYERALRGKTPDEHEAALHLPPWLAEGLREAISWKAGKSDRRLYEGIFKRGGLFKMDDLFSVDEKAVQEMDAATRAAFHVSAGALLMALIEQPQGKNGFRSFLTEVPSYEGEMPALLRKNFPELNLSETSLAKWWALQLANKGTAPITDVMTIKETEQGLAECLHLTLRSPEGTYEQKELASAWQELAYISVPERTEAVRMAQDGLIRLSYRCFPASRPLLNEYQLILAALVQNKTQNMAGRLAGLDEARVELVAKANRMRDYMDYFEITRARETSGAFADYMRLKAGLQSVARPRKDALSLYLDKMDALFNRGQESTPVRQMMNPPVNEATKDIPLILPE